MYNYELNRIERSKIRKYIWREKVRNNRREPKNNKRNAIRRRRRWKRSRKNLDRTKEKENKEFKDRGHNLPELLGSAGTREEWIGERGGGGGWHRQWQTTMCAKRHTVQKQRLAQFQENPFRNRSVLRRLAEEPRRGGRGRRGRRGRIGRRRRRRRERR